MTQPVSPLPTITPSIDQPLGDIVANWTSRPHPLDNPLYHTIKGQYCRLELLNSKTNSNIIQQLYDAFKPTEQTHFTYLPYGPFQTLDEFKEFIYSNELPSSNIVMYSILVNEVAVGYLCFVRIDQQNGTIEIGGINFSQHLVRTRQGTESIFLLLEYAFDILGYKRVQWSCNALNSKSRQAALRLGFQYEGTWLKTFIYKGRSRDNAWFSIVDDEWPVVKKELQRWLNPENFDINGQQLTKLNAAQVNPRQDKVIDMK
ncbi:unnamed protein product [Rotaria sp. Silwood1]|nr:unnamed protein product [Rotaria sp. Silwood1]CAF1608352.1 unnamed protein product [Rotaria sp. Silwood1]